MKTAVQTNCQILTDGDVVYGIFLAADFTAEHENGISGIKSCFGISQDPQTFADQKITRNGGIVSAIRSNRKERLYKGNKSEERKTESALILANESSKDRCFDLTSRFSEDVIIAGAFDEREFTIRGYGPQGIAAVEIIAEGFKEDDIAIWMGGGGVNPFERGGLVIARYSMVPENLVATFDKGLAEARLLKEAGEATGIRELIMEKIKGRYGVAFFALNPKWAFGDFKNKTAHPVVYWLNPFDQQNNNYGYFTVEELEQWTRGEGPIPKEKSNA